MNNTYKINDIFPRGRAKKEWAPVPGTDSLLSPVLRGICGAFRVTMWLQIGLIALVLFAPFLFLMSNSKQVFPIVFCSVMGAVFLLQLIMGAFYRKKAVAVLSHYTSYNHMEVSVPDDEIVKQLQIADLKDDADRCVRASVFGIIVCLLFALCAGIVSDKIDSLESFINFVYIDLYAFTLPAFGVWAWIYYQEEGALAFLGLIAGGFVDYWFGFPVSPILLLSIGVYLIATSRAVVILRFFAVYVAVVLLFLGMVALFLSSARGVNMSVFVCILVACFLPALIQLVLYVCFRNSTVEVMPDGAEKSVLLLKRTRIMDFLYTYVWGTLCMLFCLAGLIANLCSDEYNLINYTKSRLEQKRVNSFETKSIEFNPDLSAYERFDNPYGSRRKADESFYPGSYRGNSGSRYDSSSSRYNRYDYEAPRSSNSSDRDSGRSGHNEYDYSYRKGSGSSSSSGLRFW